MKKHKLCAKANLDRFKRVCYILYRFKRTKAKAGTTKIKEGEMYAGQRRAAQGI